MKTVTVDKIIKETEYEAGDGTRFRDREQCLKYEEAAEVVVLSRLKVLNRFTESDVFMSGSDEVDVTVVNVKDNLQDIKLLFAMQNCTMSINEDDILLIYHRTYNDKIDGMWFQTYKDLTNGILCQ